MTYLPPKLRVSSLVTRSAQSSGKTGTPLSLKPPFLPQESTKLASKGTGAFPNLCKTPLRTSGGSTQSAMKPVSGLTPLQAGLRTGLPAQSSIVAGLPEVPFTSKTVGMTRAAPSAGATAHKPVTPAASMHLGGSPLPGQGMCAIRGHHTTGSPRINQQAANPSEQSLRSNRPSAPALQTQADTRLGATNAYGSDESDSIMKEAIQGRQADPKPWTSTCLAAGLMDNMRHLEEMLLEVQQMHDDVLEQKVNVAISSNRLTRLDNPIVHDKLRRLKRQAEMIFQSS